MNLFCGVSWYLQIVCYERSTGLAAGRMYILQLVGDLSHFVAIILLQINMWKTKSCAGISGKSQILFAIAYITRWLDVVTTFVSVYNTAMKVVFIVSSVATLCLIYVKFKATYDQNHDSFRIEFVLVPCFMLALLINAAFTPLEVLWTFSIYLEAVAILPQMVLVSKTDEAEGIIRRYLIALGLYRALYLFNWIYRYYVAGHYDLIAIYGGVIGLTTIGITYETSRLPKSPQPKTSPSQNEQEACGEVVIQEKSPQRDEQLDPSTVD